MVRGQIRTPRYPSGRNCFSCFRKKKKNDKRLVPEKGEKRARPRRVEAEIWRNQGVNRGGTHAAATRNVGGDVGIGWEDQVELAGKPARSVIRQAAETVRARLDNKEDPGLVGAAG